ncbi:5-hydroxytryptamine receptor 1E-like [Stylophora pistillata]|uniref:5-hydroxytryptamine receptor 1E-like n=1 Tax=Stylophora pistillata TaxID=50429 RepID=UPI000C044278|nr:5-hydroxytryptamine receptor 1E-like [Stylophora pistillata]
MESNSSEQENFCFHLGDPSFHKTHERFTVNLATAIINTVTAPVGVIANLLIVTAIFSCPRLRIPSNLLVASLALSDVFVALTVQPGYITYRLMENQRRLVPCFVRIVYNSAFFICFGVSFMTLSAVSYERFVAVRLRARYNEFFSSTRVIRYALIIWTVNVLLTSLKWTAIESVIKSIHLTVWSICLLVSVATQIGVLYVVRKQRGHRYEVDDNYGDEKCNLKINGEVKDDNIALHVIMLE